ncbi:MAG: aminoacyl-tRNA deacylase [Casimicrobiaceae bacterium]
MAKSVDYPITTAIRALRAAKLAFVPHLYDDVERGGTAHSAVCLGVDEHEIIKTIVLETETRAPLICLQHGDREISLKSLARHLGVKSVRPCEPETALRHTGYKVGGTSPFGARKPLPVYAERSIQMLPRMFLNGGRRGFLVELDPRAALAALSATLVEASA